MCWVRARTTRGNEVLLNLSVSQMIREESREFEVFYPGDEAPYRIDKTPEMVEAVNSLVKSQPVVPAESDDDWVTQDRLPVRVGIDQFRYVPTDGRNPWDWQLAQAGDNWDSVCTHGWVDMDEDRLELRCRRRDLPKQEKPFA